MDDDQAERIARGLNRIAKALEGIDDKLENLSKCAEEGVGYNEREVWHLAIKDVGR